MGNVPAEAKLRIFEIGLANSQDLEISPDVTGRVMNAAMERWSGGDMPAKAAPIQREYTRAEIADSTVTIQPTVAPTPATTGLDKVANIARAEEIASQPVSEVEGEALASINAILPKDDKLARLSPRQKRRQKGTIAELPPIKIPNAIDIAGLDASIQQATLERESLASEASNVERQLIPVVLPSPPKRNTIPRDTPDDVGIMLLQKALFS